MCRKRNGAAAQTMGTLGSVVSTCSVISGEAVRIDVSSDTYFDPAKWIRGLGYMAEHVSIRENLFIAFLY